MPVEREPDAASETSPGVRLDLWLWAARFFKTRALAKQAIETHRVELQGEAVGKPSKTVRAGNQLSVRRGDERFEIVVLAVSEKRGPASVAQQMYREDEASVERRLAEREQRRLQNAGVEQTPHRPTKKQRRQIRGLPGGKSEKLPPWWPQ
jgi:ribosome-associated heat shock protein Hsp15